MGWPATGRFAFWRRSPATAEAVWDARGMGQTTGEIAAMLGLSRRPMENYICQCGGLRPQKWASPSKRLSYEERLLIKELLIEKHSYRQIAAKLGRAPSTIGREIKLGSAAGTRAQYKPARAQNLAWFNRLRPKPLKSQLTGPCMRPFSPGWITSSLRNRSWDDYTVITPMTRRCV